MAGRISTQLIFEGINKSKRAFQEVTKDLELTNKAASSAGKALAGFLSVGALAAGVKAVTSTADSYQLMNARLKLATGSQDEFNVAQTELARIAAATSSPVESLVTLYGRISRPLKEAGRSQKDILGVTEAVAASFRVSGASAEEAENGVIQFAQALGSGALRGDEFNSVAEQSPRLMQALADGIGVPVGALKNMAAQGQLTASVVTDALLGQLPKIQQELAGFGETVSGQVVQIEDVLKRGIGQADTGPLVGALKELKTVLADPAIMQNLTALAGALVKVAEYAVKGGAAFAQLGNDAGYTAARLTGNLDKMDYAERQIRDFQSAIDGFGMADLQYTDQELKTHLEEWKAYRQALILERTGMTEDAKKAADDTAAQVKAVDDARRESSLSAERAYIESLQHLRDQQVEAKKAALKVETAAEAKANSEIEKVRKDRMDIEKRYSLAIAELHAGVAGDPTYSAAQDLKVGAQKALKAGDIDGAKAQAQAALKVLQQLAAAGENTYGFEGFAKGLRDIELAANSIEDKQAVAKRDAIQAQMEQIKQSAEALKNLPITLNLAPEEVTKVKTALQELAGTPIIIPVQLQQTPEMAAMGLQGQGQVNYPGYASGTNNASPGIHWVGENGPELMSFAGGEQVLNASASKRLADRMSGMQLPGNNIDAVSSAVAVGPTSLGTLNLTLDGQTYQMHVPEQDFGELVKRQKWKRGRI